jgi:hypothetical protein
MIDGREFKVSANVGVNQLHEDLKISTVNSGCHVVRRADAAGVEFRYLSADGEEVFRETSL